MLSKQRNMKKRQGEENVKGEECYLLRRVNTAKKRPGTRLAAYATWQPMLFPPLLLHTSFPTSTNTNCESLVVYMHNADSAHLYLCKYLSLSNYLYLYLCMSGLAWFTFRFCASSEKDMFVGKNKQKSPKHSSPE